VHEPGREGQRRADGPGQQEDPVDRAPEGRRPFPVPALGRPGDEPGGAQDQAQHQGEREEAPGHLARPLDHQVEPDQGHDPRQHHDRLERRGHRQGRPARPGDVGQVERLHAPAQERQAAPQVPPQLAAHEEPGQLDRQRQPVRPGETEDLQPIHSRWVPLASLASVASARWDAPRGGRVEPL
ncbi:hypothetical protein HK102_012950, partial [Quaeritorhiza haematococci]